MVSTLKRILLVVLVAAAICVPIVLLTHHALMPSSAQLAQIDAAVQQAVPAGSTVRRLPAPDRIETDGNAKTGYFTYEVTADGAVDKYKADWRIAEGQVRIVSFEKL